MEATRLDLFISFPPVWWRQSYLKRTGRPSLSSVSSVSGALDRHRRLFSSLHFLSWWRRPPARTRVPTWEHAVRPTNFQNSPNQPRRWIGQGRGV